MTLQSEARFGVYSPTDFGWPHQVPDLVPLTFDGVSFGSCARDAHGVFLALLTELVPHIKGGLHAGSCGAYSTTDDLAGGVWSFHRYGIAIDVNWNVNKMGVPAPASGRYAIPHTAASQIARKYGCEYGGDWTNPKDWMHFEVHLTPQVARTVQPSTTPATAEEFTVDKDAQKEFDKIYNLLYSALAPLGPDGKTHQVSVDTIVARRVNPALSAAVASQRLITELGKRVAALQAAADSQARLIGALQAQVTDLANGKVNVSGQIPATLTIGSQS